MNKLLILLFVMLSFHVAVAQQQTDTAAIKTLLQKESATWRSGDVNAHASCWHIQPYTRILVSTVDGKCYDVAPENVINPPPGSMGKGGTVELKNFKFSIHKNYAWVSHDEISTAVDNSKSYSHEIRLLEKIRGKWKLVGQSIHLYKPE